MAATKASCLNSNIVSRPWRRSDGVTTEGFILHLETPCWAAVSKIGLPLVRKTIVLATCPSLASTTRSLTDPSEPVFKALLGNFGFGAESQSEVAASPQTARYKTRPAM